MTRNSIWKQIPQAPSRGRFIIAIYVIYYILQYLISYSFCPISFFWSIWFKLSCMTESMTYRTCNPTVPRRHHLKLSINTYYLKAFKNLPTILLKMFKFIILFPLIISGYYIMTNFIIIIEACSSILFVKLSSWMYGIDSQ